MTITQHGREQKQLNKLYEDFDAMGLIPLWTIRDNLMPMSPRPQALPHLWRWADLLPLAERSGELVPVGHGCARRAIALSNPGLPGLPYATPNLWAAIHYLAPHEVAPATGTARARSALSSRVRASGRTWTATRWRCGAVTCCWLPAGPTTSTTTPPIVR